MSNFDFTFWNEQVASGCEVCAKFIDDLKPLLNMNDSDNMPRSVKLIEENHKHCKQKHRLSKKQFAFTLTTNSDDRASAQSQLCFAVLRLFEQRTNPIAQGGAWLEYTEAGRPHIHGWYETKDGGRVFAKTFARCWPLWKEKRGLTRFGGGYHEEMKTNRYLAYASAEGREVIRKNLNEPFIFNEKAERLEPTA